MHIYHHLPMWVCVSHHFHLSRCEPICVCVFVRTHSVSFFSQSLPAVPSLSLWADSSASQQSSVMESWYLPPLLQSLCAFHLLLRCLWLIAIPASQSPILYLHHYFPYLGKLFAMAHKENLSVPCTCSLAVCYKLLCLSTGVLGD